jgi:hypothetical protein
MDPAKDAAGIQAACEALEREIEALRAELAGMAGETVA